MCYVRNLYGKEAICKQNNIFAMSVIPGQMFSILGSGILKGHILSTRSNIRKYLEYELKALE